MNDRLRYYLSFEAQELLFQCEGCCSLKIKHFEMISYSRNTEKQGRGMD